MGHIHNKRSILAGCLILSVGGLFAQSAPTSENTTVPATNLGNTTVIASKLDEARSQILPDLGATSYSITDSQIDALPQGESAAMNDILLRAPGVAQDSSSNGDLHVRGEHANLQYRINGILLPEGISGFGTELDGRFVDNMQLLTGALPAQYGFRTAGIVDIQTKSGAFDNGSQASVMVGSHGTIEPGFETSGHDGKLDYFIDTSYEKTDLGIENPTSSYNAIHDLSNQYKTFGYFSYIIDDSSRWTFMDSASYANYQIPVNPSLQPVSTQGNSNPWVSGSFSPTDLNDNQNEQNYYGVLAYQKSTGSLDYQAAIFGRESSAHYVPGNIPAALYYNGGVATDVNRILDSGGFQADGTYHMNDTHTLRGGLMAMEEWVDAKSNTTVFPVDGSGNINGASKIITQSNTPSAFFGGMYLQDEWKFAPQWTLNYGGRFDVYSSSFDNEWQLSPRVNLVYQPSSKTTWHIGYARYFTPPPLEAVSASSVSAFNGTSGASSITQDSPVKAERSNYFDIGVSQKVAEGFQLGLDAYYKRARNQLDDGLFGQSLILSSFNYTKGRVGGIELTASYDHGGFSSYANVAYSVAQGKGTASSQFLWPDQGTLNYVNNHWISLDHDQRVTASTGASYTWGNPKKEYTRTGMDLLIGSGLREDSNDTIGGSVDPTDPIPNGASVPAYYTLNAFVERRFKLQNGNFLKARLDVVNLTDNGYQLRSGSGVGVNAAQYGARRGFFGTLAYSF